MTVMTAANQSSSLPAAAVVAACALAFTVASFWWLNARQGKLRSYAPHTFAAAANRQRTVIRIPLVFFNTGPKPIVVQDIRLDLAYDTSKTTTLAWGNTRDRIRPESDDGVRLPAVFAINGRTAEQIFIEFTALFPEFIPQLREYRASVRCKVGHREKLITVVEFPLHLENISSPTNYIAYSNSLGAIKPDKADEARAELERLRTEAQKMVEQAQQNLSQ
ncbi:hypothetical protein [Streptomyces sp. R527F]|uniref:hypothetical protein n=1 Tax=Streptomyces sp. R527F TaxID=1664033 RepID=UPI001F340D9C|nr:hypothetical protein [Streptomyces sp. R527F]UIZ15739.1 hypothetical protein LZ559_26845 [Streptomyces sp. R527F]